MSKFKTRARAVDMLGRQQIAGVPTAISELFKNAHDAYADHVVVDYFKSDGLFVLRDDGLGMTKNDFEDRWLTIGTESKLLYGKGIKQPPIDPTKKPRSITGEKGIGRLAIAVIGPQVLVLTRANKNKKLHDLVAAFLHWGLFEAPGINLDQIEIPVVSYSGGSLPNNEDIKTMVDVVYQNVLDLKKNGFIENTFAKKIIRDLEKFDFNLLETAKSLGIPTLLEGGCGTHFYILPSTENLAADLDADLGGEGISRLKKLLLGFWNTMIPNSPPPLISTSFRYWLDDDHSEDIISDREFFTPDDFKSVDHHIEGKFDEFGQFVGNISIYGKKAFRHVIPSPKSITTPISCGPFGINFGYVQGLAGESKVPPEIHARILQKLNRIGGLYIYQDNIRILPYGDFDVDFLGFEKRRTKSISEAFFSYRRMFGAIELTRQRNSNLVEKAGREGFQENKAYREFKAILENFFIQLAADFFREGGQHADIWIETREEMKRLSAARKQQEQISRKKRRDFQAQVDAFFKRLNEGEPQKDVAYILSCLRNRIIDATQKEEGIALLDAEMSATRELAALRDKYKVELPQGVGLGQLKRDWNAYAKEMEVMEKDVFSPTQNDIKKIINEASQQLNFALDQKQRVDLLVNEIIVDAQNEIQTNTKFTQEVLDNLQNRIQQLKQEITNSLRETTEKIRDEMKDIDITQSDRDEIENYRHKWENLIIEEAKKYNEVLVHVRTQLENINWYHDENGYLIGDAEKTAALEDEVLDLREQADANLELTQLGMAIDIINHEFSNTIKVIRNNLRQFKTWAEVNPKLLPIYNGINDSFTHLDGYLTLFTPLNRRLYRAEVKITGSNIATYLNDLFRERLESQEIKLTPSQAFRDMVIVGYPSTFYPVFINLVDNAMYWLRDHPIPREIKLDARGNSFIVSDNGPGVSRRDRDAVFELGFTRKPGGRGMGLYISREVLKKDNYELLLSKKSPDGGATFIICPINIKSSLKAG